jgi:hypothetical protein
MRIPGGLEEMFKGEVVDAWVIIPEGPSAETRVPVRG